MNIHVFIAINRSTFLLIGISRSPVYDKMHMRNINYELLPILSLKYMIKNIHNQTVGKFFHFWRNIFVRDIPHIHFKF